MLNDVYIKRKSLSISHHMENLLTGKTYNKKSKRFKEDSKRHAFDYKLVCRLWGRPNVSSFT